MNNRSASLIFFSHAAADRGTVAGLVGHLRHCGWRSLYASSHAEAGNTAGEDWESAIYARLRRASAVVFVLTETSARSTWCFAELALAKALGTPILTVRAALDTPLHPLTSHQQAVDLTDSAARERIRQWVERHVGPPHRQWPEGVCPYPGMRSFTSDLEPVFFGREAAVADLLPAFAPLGSQGGARRLVAVSGPSGSGKSSFVMAGLAPRLARRPGWRVLPPMRAGVSPLHNLADVLASAVVDAGGVAAIREDLARGDIALFQALTENRPDGERTQLVLIVDQFEELDTLAEDAERQAFLALLDQLTQGAHPIWLLLTVRSEFVASGSEQSPIAAFIGRHGVNYLLLPLLADPAGLRRVVAGPATLAGAQLSDALMDRIVADVHAGDHDGSSLPLLAFALHDTWQAMAERVGPMADRELTLADYESTGGVGEIISRQAAAAQRRCAMLGHGELVLPTLARFAVPGRHGEATLRRRVPVASLNDAARAVAREFEQNRLLRVAEIDGVASYEVTHEALFSAWPDVRRYVEEHHNHLQDLIEAERRATAWLRHGRDSGDLLRGALLHRLTSRPGQETDRSALVEEFLQASVESDSEMQRALVQQEADRTARAALVELPIRPLWVRSVILRSANQCAAAGAEPGQVLQDAAFTVLCRVRERFRRRDGAAAVRVVAVHTGRDLVAAGGDDRVVRLWRLSDGQPQQAVHEFRAGISALAFSPDGRHLAAAADDGALLFWHLGREGRAGRCLGGMPGAAVDLAFTPSGDMLAVLSTEGVLGVWDLGSPQDPLATVIAHAPYASACGIHPDGTRAYTGGADGSLALWTLPFLELVRRAEGAHQEPVLSLAVADDGRAVASGGLDGQLRTWHPDLVPRGSVRWSRSRTSFVTGVAFVPGGRALVSVGSDGSVRQWDVECEPLEEALTGDGEPLTTVAVGGDPKVIVTGGSDRVLRWWRYAGSLLADPVDGMPDTVEALAFVDNDRFLVAHGSTIGMFDRSGVAVGDPWVGHEDQVWDITVSPDGRMVVTSSADGTLRRWHPDGRQAGPPLPSGTELGITTVRFGDDRQGMVVSGGSDGVVRLWSLDGSPPSELGRHEGQVNRAEFVRYGSGWAVLSAADDGELRLWSPTGECLAARRMASSPLKDLAVRHGVVLCPADGGELVTLRTDLSDIGHRVAAHDGRITEILAHPALPVMTVGADGMLRCWTTELAPVGEPRQADPDGVWAVAASPDGRLVVTGGNERICLWRGGSWRDWIAELAADEPPPGAEHVSQTNGR